MQVEFASTTVFRNRWIFCNRFLWLMAVKITQKHLLLTCTQKWSCI